MVYDVFGVFVVNKFLSFRLKFTKKINGIDKFSIYT